MPAVSLVFGEPIDLGIPAGCSQDGQCVSIGSGPSAVIVASQPSANQLVITGTRTDTVALDPAVASAHTTLQAVGPDDVVYLTVQASAQLDPVGQLVAVATTGPQRGRVIATSTDLVDLSGDTSLMPTESGLVPVNCCDDAIDIPASSSAALLGWVDQLGNPGATLEASVSLQREPAALTIVRSSALGRSTWRIDGVADFRGIPVNSPLGDGGVIVALNYERGPDGRAQSEIFRLTPDGFVATAKLDGIPIAFNVDGGVITVADERFKLVPTELPHA